MTLAKVVSLAAGMPEQLGKYVLEKRIGAGGMADVFLARGPTGVCVVKRPHPHLCNSPEFVKMFLDEASLVAQLNHPGIARVFDLGQVNGVYYLAMEYVPGYDLMTISLEHERHGEYMAPELAARVMADAALALHYAHDAVGARGQPLNIIHRDVTPHNVLLSTGGQVKVIDFGVAKAADTMHRTQAGLVKGKYPYMAPEQITGQKIDRRVDVYALGLVLYELLTNARAIAGEMEVEQIENARHMRIKPVEQLRPNTPEPLKIILNSCFQMNPEKRYPTAAALAADLEKYLVYEGHKVGREDLLRLFRVIAADHGKLPSDVVPAEPLDKTYKGAMPVPPPVGSGSSIGGAVNAALNASPGLATDAAAAKTDLEVPSSNPQIARLPSHGQVQLGGAAVLQLGDAQIVGTDKQPALLLAPTDQHVPAATGQLPLNGAAPLDPDVGPAPLSRVDAAPPPVTAPPSSRPPIALLAAGVVLAIVVGVLGLKVYQGSRTVEPPKDPIVVAPSPVKDPEPPVVVKDPEPPPVVVKDPEPPPVVVKDPEPVKNPEPVKPPPTASSDVTYAFKSTPPTALTIDGKPRGTTPLELELKPGKHTLVFADAASGQKKSLAFFVKAGKPDTIEWTVPEKAQAPAAPAMATLQLEATPFATKYVVDGKQVASSKSFHELELAAGRHTIEFVIEDPSLTKTIKRVVELKGGGSEKVAVNFLTDS